jgi:hypothetical protein
MTAIEEYRIRECNGVFTIQKNRFIKQFRMFRPSKIVEQWEDVDKNGCFIYMPILEKLNGKHHEYNSIVSAKTAMNQFIEGVKYHYPIESN